MAIDFEYQHVTHLALLSVLRVQKVVGTTPPPAAQYLPAVVAVQYPVLRQCHNPHQFVSTAAFVKKQLCLLQVDG